MAIRDLVPFLGRESSGLARREYESPFQSLHREMNRLFEDFYGRATTPFGAGAYVPRVDVNDTPENVEVSAELPGLTQKDVDLSISPDGETLMLRGEKKHEREEKREGSYFSERSYGAFHRSISLPAPVDEEHAEANMKDGVLHVKLLKRKQGEGGPKKIPIAG